MVGGFLGTAWLGVVPDPRMSSQLQRLWWQRAQDTEGAASSRTWTGLPGRVSGLHIRTKGLGPTEAQVRC